MASAHARIRGDRSPAPHNPSRGTSPLRRRPMDDRRARPFKGARGPAASGRPAPASEVPPPRPAPPPHRRTSGARTSFVPGQLLRVIATCPNFGPRSRHRRPLRRVEQGTVGQYLYTATRRNIGEVAVLRLVKQHRIVMVRTDVLAPYEPALAPAIRDAAQ